MFAARCSGCGAGLAPNAGGGSAARCSYCGLTHHVPLGVTQMRAVIREEVNADRNCNGVPDVFEQRALVLSAPAPISALSPRTSTGLALVLGMSSVLLLGVIGAFMSLRAEPVRTPVAASPPPVVAPPTPLPTPVVLPIPELTPPRLTPKSASKPSSRPKPSSDDGKTDVTPLGLCNSRAAGICASYDAPDCARARARCNGL